MWKECKWKDWYMERVFRARAQESYILFGYGLTGKERERMTKKMTALENEKDENGKALAPEKIAANKYDEFFKSKSKSKYTRCTIIKLTKIRKFLDPKIRLEESVIFHYGLP